MKNDALVRMYSVCSDALILATQLGSAPDLPNPEILRQRINATFEALRTRARQMDVPSADAMEAIYAIAAFMDEQILRSPWPARQQWMAQPLQLMYFQENTAGEGFFHRLAALEADPERAHVVQIYALCLALGFRGRYAVANPGELPVVLERAVSQLTRRLPNAETFSPAGYPSRQKINFSPKQFPVVAVALGFLGFSIVLFIVLMFTTSVSADNAAERIVATATQGVPGSKSP